MEELTISKAARRSGVGVETIRFYEHKELIPRPPRPVSGSWQYPAKTVLRIRFIKRAKELGFTLKEIKDLLEMRIDPSTTCEDILSLAKTKIVDIDGKIKTLKKMRKASRAIVTLLPGGEINKVLDTIADQGFKGKVKEGE